MSLGIQKVIDGGNGNAILYTALLAAIVANCTPTPADAVYFWRQQVDKQLLNENKITPKQYWVRTASGYYVYTAGWYLMVFATLASINSNYKNNSRALIALVGAGIVVGVVAKNIEKDEQLKKIA